MVGGDPKFCRFLGNDLRKKISALQIDHDPPGTILYIATKKLEYKVCFARKDSIYIYIVFILFILFEKNIECTKSIKNDYFRGDFTVT